MPRYSYTAKTQPHSLVHGNIEADSENDALTRLSKMGYFPLLLKEEDLSSERKSVFSMPRVPHKEVIVFTRQLSDLLASGINILRALQIIDNQSSHHYFKAVLNQVTGKIKDGISLSESLSAHPKIFSELFTSMVRSGEISGSLDKTLKRLADFLEKEEEFKNSIKSALIYPAFVLAVGILTVAVLLGFVIPKLVSMFEDMGQSLPLPTKMLIRLSNGLQSYWGLILVTLVVGFFLIKRFYKTNEGRLVLDSMKLKTVFFGPIILMNEISSFTRTLSLLLSSGINIVYALEIASLTVRNRPIQLEVKNFKESINKGTSFSGCVKNSKLFPAYVVDIVVIGEETGTLEKSLLSIADTYEKKAAQSLKDFTRLLEPLIILAMGIVVGFIVISLLLPIFQINLLVR